MKPLRLDKRGDLYLAFKPIDRVLGSKEIDEDIRLEYDNSGKVAGIEIMNARRNLAKTLAQVAKETKAKAQ